LATELPQASGNAVETTRLRIEGRLITTPLPYVCLGVLARSIACPGSPTGPYQWNGSSHTADYVVTGVLVAGVKARGIPALCTNGSRRRRSRYTDSPMLSTRNRCRRRTAITIVGVRAAISVPVPNRGHWTKHPWWPCRTLICGSSRVRQPGHPAQLVELIVVTWLLASVCCLSSSSTRTDSSRLPRLGFDALRDTTTIIHGVGGFIASRSMASRKLPVASYRYSPMKPRLGDLLDLVLCVAQCGRGLALVISSRRRSNRL